MHHHLRNFILIALFMLLSIPLSAQGYACTSADNPLDHTEAGDAFYDNGDYQLAIEAYSCALALNDAFGDAYNGRGSAYYELGEYESAIDDLSRALELDITDPAGTLNDRGLAYFYLNRFEEAEADFVEGLTYAPEAGYLINNRGIVYYEQGDYETAIAFFTEAIDIQDYADRYIPLYNRGISHYELGNFEQAEEDILASIELDPTYARSYLVLGNRYDQLGRPEAAENHLEWVELITTDRISNQSIGTLEPLTLSIIEGRAYYLPVQLEAGQLVDFAARSASNADLDPIMVLLAPDGTPIESDDDSGVNLDAVIASFDVAESGIYTLVVSHAGGGSNGDVTITISIDGSIAESFPIYELLIGERASVYTSGGDRLNLRSGPGLNFDVVSRLDTGTTVTLLEGPRKADGYAWWLIRTENGEEGWSVERVETQQTLQPFMEIGGQALVNTTSGEKLNVRIEPGTNFDLAAQLIPGTVVTLIDGPFDSDVYTWWKIRTEDGIEGWAVERVGEEHTLIGLPSSGE